MPDRILLPLNLVNAMLSYLGKQPYEEVFQLIGAIKKEGDAQITPPAATEE